MEGHWDRSRLPVGAGGRRERWVLAAAAAAAIVAVAIVLFAILSGGSASRADCVKGTIPSTMGASEVHACGPAARRLCAAQAGRTDRFAREVQAACANLGPGRR
jgi:hypothetical protein